MTGNFFYTTTIYIDWNNERPKPAKANIVFDVESGLFGDAEKLAMERNNSMFQKESYATIDVIQKMPVPYYEHEGLLFFTFKVHHVVFDEAKCKDVIEKAQYLIRSENIDTAKAQMFGHLSGNYTIKQITETDIHEFVHRNTP